MPLNDPLGYYRPNDLMGMERLGLQRDRLGMQEEQFATTNALRQQAARQKAIESMMKLRGGGGGLQEAIYTDITGGMKPGATRHNELLDQDQFWRGIREQSMDRPQPQGLYRVGDEYGFNGEAMGNLSQMAPAGTSPDDYFDQIQAKHFANQERMAGAELDSNMGDMTAQYRQAAAQQMAERRSKDAEAYFKGFEGRYGVNPGVAFQPFRQDGKNNVGYNMDTGIAYLPGSTKMTDTGPQEIPGTSIAIPRAERDAYGRHAAFMAGYDSEDAMQMADPRIRAQRKLQKYQQQVQDAAAQIGAGPEVVQEIMQRLQSGEQIDDTALMREMQVLQQNRDSQIGRQNDMRMEAARARARMMSTQPTMPGFMMPGLFSVGG